MTKEVLVTIVGNQGRENEVALITAGSYYFKDDKHYVFYEEHTDPDSQVIKNRICFDASVFEMSKKGGVNSTMTFDQKNITLTTYQTPYGPIQLTVVTDHYEFHCTEDVMEMDIYYALDFGGRDSTDCHVYVKVEARQDASAADS